MQAFINPHTVVGFVQCMRNEGHTALIHTAAASALGQMLVKYCIVEKVPLVNIVRKAEQAELLKSLGAYTFAAKLYSSCNAFIL
jgi:hypothetical protein